MATPTSIPLEECDDGNAADNDACRNDCEVSTCGDGVRDVAHGEQCDDGGTLGGDGCDGSCKTELIAQGTVPEGATSPVVVTTDPGATGASVDAPVQAAIASTVPGPISVLVTSHDGTPAPGFVIAGKTVRIEAQPGSQANPLRLTFVLDASQVPGDLATLLVFRDDVRSATARGPCSHPTPTRHASPSARSSPTVTRVWSC